MSHYNIYNKDFHKKERNLKSVIILFFICLAGLVLLILLSSGDDKSGDWKIKGEGQEQRTLVSSEAGTKSLSSNVSVVEKPGSFLSAEEKLAKNNLVKFDRLIQNFIKIDLLRAKTTFTTFARGCTTYELMESISEQVKEGRSASIRTLWNGPNWIDFFNNIYQDIREQRIFFGATSPADTRNLTTVARPAHCRNSLISIAGSFVFVKDKFVSKVEQGNRLGLFPGDAQEILDKYNLDLAVMEELSDILTNIKIELE